MAAIQHRSIGGKPYTVRPNEFGWAVCPAESPTDRFHRAYQVFADGRGQPSKCSCPDCVYRANWCKHLREIEAMLNDAQ